MILLWSTTNQWGSRMIRWGRGDDCSHFAVCFDKLVKGCAVVGDSRLGRGVSLGWLENFKRHNKIVHALEYLPVSDDRELFCAFGKKMAGREYDKKAILWLAFDSLLQKLKVRNPYSENKWGDREDVYCQEVLEAFGKIFAGDGIMLTYRDIEMLDPHEAYEMLKKAPQFRKIIV